MRQYKAALNPLLSANYGNTHDQITRIAAYQEFRTLFGAWVQAEIDHASAKSKLKTSAIPADRDNSWAERYAYALCSALDFQRTWGQESEISAIAGSILHHVAEWSDEIRASPLPMPRELATRDIAEEISEISMELHFSICEEVGILAIDHSVE
ncbi:hypothetical protein Hesp01_70410 [Herbidospora sp. NBRC 101105]|nr:hypothetical protein Hesp01_70410 [Herbidospora sp. NBRC 101105]